MPRAAALAALVLAAACHAPPEQPKAVAEPLPSEVCDQAKEAVAKLTDGGALVLRTPTDGVMQQDVWVPAAPKAKDAMLNAIGLAATCAGQPQLEQEVTIHSEYGELMTRRLVKTSYSTAEALAE